MWRELVMETKPVFGLRSDALDYLKRLDQGEYGMTKAEFQDVKDDPVRKLLLDCINFNNLPKEQQEKQIDSLNERCRKYASWMENEIVEIPERDCMEALTRRDEIRQAYDSFEKRMTAGSETFQRTVGYKGGNQDVIVHWHLTHGMWGHMSVRCCSWGYYWCAFGFENPSDRKNLTAICQIDFPCEGVNRRLAGAFAVDQNGKTCIVHSGGVGGGRKGISKTAFWKFFGTRGQVVTTFWPDRREYFLVGYLDDHNLVERIASFAREVSRFKEQAVGPD